MSADTADLLTSLYALRSQAGVVRTHAERQRNLALAAKLAGMQEEISGEIERAQARPDYGIDYSGGQGTARPTKNDP